MAGKRKRAQGSMGHLTQKETNALQDRMDSIASQEYWYTAEGKHASAREQASRLRGALEAAEAIGMSCSCFKVTERLRQCACGRNDPAMQNKKKNLKASYRQFSKESIIRSFAGVHCRDSEGEFVPVPQCRRTKRKTLPKGLSGVHCRDSEGLFVPVPQCLRQRKK